MLRILMLLLLVLCTGCGKKEVLPDDLDAINSRGEVIIGVREDARPFGFVQNGELVGYEIDLANIIADRLGVSAKLVPVTGQERISKLNSGEVDMLIATMSVTPQRQQVLEFSFPYHVAGQAILVLQGTKGTTLQEFNDKRMIIVFGSTSERNLRLNLPDAELIGYKTYPEAYAALKAGNGEAMMADDTLLLGLALNDPAVKILQKRYSREPYAIALRKDSDRLLSAVDGIIKELQNSGELTKLQSKWGVKK
jgi:putative glutamine transport system substrate-binding protein